MLTIVLPGARDCESEWAGSRPPLWLPTPSTKRARRHTRQDGAALTRDPWLNTCHGESPVSQPIHALAHVDHPGADFDALGTRADRRGERALGRRARRHGGRRRRLAHGHGGRRGRSRGPIGTGPRAAGMAGRDTPATPSGPVGG